MAGDYLDEYIYQNLSNKKCLFNLCKLYLNKVEQKN